MFSVRWTETALRDLEDALLFLRLENPPAAQRLKDRVFKTVSYLESFSLGLPAPKGLQKLFIPKTSYFVIFKSDKRDNIEIVALIHASRDWEQFDWENL